MAEYITTRPNAEKWVNKFHDRLGVPDDYHIESGGALGPAGIMIRTDSISQSALEYLVDAANSLVLSADKYSIAADGIEETVIACASLPTDFDYRIYSPSGFKTAGTVNDGLLELSLVETGLYLIEIREQSSNNTGFIEITGV